MTTDTLIKITKLLCIICAVVLLIIKIPEWRMEIKLNRECKARMEYYRVHGIGNVTRGGNRADTVKVDSILKK